MWVSLNLGRSRVPLLPVLNLHPPRYAGDGSWIVESRLNPRSLLLHSTRANRGTPAMTGESLHVAVVDIGKLTNREDSRRDGSRLP
jgi:hypothetical protein